MRTDILRERERPKSVENVARDMVRRKEEEEQTKAVEGDQQQKCSEPVPLEHSCCKKTIDLESTYLKI